MAERSLYINIVRVLWGFDISKKKDANGTPIEPTLKMVKGFLTVPEPFESSITPRSANHAELMRKEFQEANEQGI